MHQLLSSLCSFLKRPPKCIFFYAASSSEQQEIQTRKQIQFLPCYLSKQQALWYSVRNVCLSNRASPRGILTSPCRPPPLGAFSEVKKKIKRNWKKKKRKRKQTCMYVLRLVLLKASASIRVLWLHLECWTLASLSFESKEYRSLFCSPFLTPP